MVSPPGPKCSGASHGPDRHGSALVARRTNDTDGGSHNTSQGLEPLSGRTLLDRDPECQEMEARERMIAISASLPNMAGTQP